MTIASRIRQPSAFIPIVMSTAALGVVLFHIVTVGTAPQPDEGAAAHIWQLLMAGQVPIVLFYAVTSLTEHPKTALPILALQVGAAIAAAAPIFLLGW
jgi:hypothetical protein